MNHIEKALEQGLPQAIAKISASLTEKYPDSAEAMQKSADLVGVYYEARGLSAHFGEQVQHFAQLVGGVAQMRPNGIKSLERSVEKIYGTKLMPLDLLAGKVIFENLMDLYHAAEQMEHGFVVVAFRDRFAEPQRSGYRDLQFIVELEGGLRAELKIMLHELDSLDVFEHRIYEIVRTLHNLRQGKVPLTVVETTVLEVLSQSSKTMYSRVWKHCLEREGGLENA
jgi:hypothetical protein